MISTVGGVLMYISDGRPTKLFIHHLTLTGCSLVDLLRAMADKDSILIARHVDYIYIYIYI